MLSRLFAVPVTLNWRLFNLNPDPIDWDQFSAQKSFDNFGDIERVAGDLARQLEGEHDRILFPSVGLMIWFLSSGFAL